MTGKELIIYILQNNLEDEPVFKDGALLGFINVEEAAMKFNVGISTIKTWVKLGMLQGVQISDNVYIPANAEVINVTGFDKAN